jgi:putative peptidoglycan lipid II flippase
MLTGAAAFGLAEPGVAVLFRRGAFGADDVVVVAGLLQILCLAVPAWVVQQVAARAFYARGDTWRPMLLGTAIAVLALPLYISLGRQAGAAGLAAAGVIAMSANALATLLLARRLHGAPDLAALAASSGRALAAALPAACAALWVQRGGAGLAGALVDLVLGVAAYAAVALPLAWLLGDEALRDALRRVARRFARRGA